MAEIISVPSQHNCRKELLRDLGDESKLYYGTVAKCSCGKNFRLENDQRDGNYWSDYNSSYYNR